MIRSKKILAHARGQRCHIALPGICCGDLATTVFAHLNGAAFGKGMGQKAHDIAGFFACHQCHTAYDLHTHGMTDADIQRALLEAVVATWVTLITDGIIKVPFDPPPTKKTKPRRPKEERAQIKSRQTKWPTRPFPKARKP